MSKTIITGVMLITLHCVVFAQPNTDSSYGVTPITNKFVQQISSKTEKYYQRVTGKTEKTLAKLSRWEIKIKTLLTKVNPQAAAQLFDNQLTFATVLAKYRQGQAIAANYGKQYDEYRDKLNSTMAYITKQKAAVDTQVTLGPQRSVDKAKAQLQQLDSLMNNTEAVQQFVKERKKQLFNQALQHIGKSKYLQKINKESYLYMETLRNYREIFNDSKKAETTVLAILDKIPAFREFIRQNSMLAGLFAVPGGGATSPTDLGLAGLQTRASVQNLIQQQFGSGPNAMAALRDNVQQAQTQLNQLKDKILQTGSSGNSNDELPNFKPNNQKTKTFLQRLEFGSNLQHQRGSSFLPVTSDIGLSMGYKLNDRSVAGIGVSGRLGWGKSIQNIRITGEGASMRSFFNWKLKSKGSFWLSGGAELNYQSRFYNASVLNNFSNWQQSALVGVMKKYGMGKKLKGSVSILYDALYKVQSPVRQPVVVRVGYNF